MQYIDEKEEVLKREDLIKEIEDLLNAVDTKHPSLISLEIAKELDMQSLLSIRKGLIQKKGKEIHQNKEWLFGLLD